MKSWGSWDRKAVGWVSMILLLEGYVFGYFYKSDFFYLGLIGIVLSIFWIWFVLYSYAKAEEKEELSK